MRRWVGRLDGLWRVDKTSACTEANCGDCAFAPVIMNERVSDLWGTTYSILSTSTFLAKRGCDLKPTTLPLSSGRASKPRDVDVEEPVNGGRWWAERLATLGEERGDAVEAFQNG